MLPKNMPGATATLSLVLMCGALLIWQDHLEPGLNAVEWERRLGEVADNAAVLKGTNVSRANLTLRGAGPVAQRAKMVAHIAKEGANSSNFSKNVTISDPMTVNKTLTLRSAIFDDSLSAVDTLLSLGADVYNDAMRQHDEIANQIPCERMKTWYFDRMVDGQEKMFKLEMDAPGRVEDWISVSVRKDSRLQGLSQPSVGFELKAGKHVSWWKAITLHRGAEFNRNLVSIGGSHNQPWNRLTVVDIAKYHIVLSKAGFLNFGRNVWLLQDALQMKVGHTYTFTWHYDVLCYPAECPSELVQR
ncbi:unnamed protein product [Symbiodinium sp. CCMP2592]|nr:unnamed protein product [Symbiodinium sp. CCMP2592]